MRTPTTTTLKFPGAVKLAEVRRLTREWERCLRAEEDAPTTEVAWRLAKRSESALRDLRAYQATGVVVRAVSRTARNLARAGFEVLATIGRAVARATSKLTALAKAHAVNRARRNATTEVGGTDQKEATVKKTTKQSKFQTVTAFARRYNRVPERMTVVTASFEVPRTATIEEMIELAHENGLSRGDRTLAGVFEIQTDAGIWSCADESKLLMRTGVGLSDKARFQTWAAIESAEVAS